MGRHFYIEQLNQPKLIKENDLQEVTNSAMFNATNGPTPDGLLSNEIFGITKEERSGIYSYISLKEKFINPYYYKLWLALDRNLRAVVYETKNFVLKDGYLVEDENGNTGIKFLVDNVDKLRFKDTKREERLRTLMEGKDKLFSDKFVIIPPYYRDASTSSSNRVGVGEINKLYVNLMNNIKALSESNDYGLSMAGGIRGKIQDIMLEIYNWFTIGETVVGGEHTGAGIFKKFGIMQRAVRSKTTDNGCRLVLSAPNINVDSKEELMVDMDHAAIPLSATCVVAYPFLLYNIRQMFTNEFGGKTHYPVINAKGEEIQYELDNPETIFSDQRFDQEINEFVHGYSNRFKKLTLPVKGGKEIELRFKGYSITAEEYAEGKRESENIIDRPLTWLDILFQCAVEAAEDKMILITRYPMDSYFNQFAIQPRVYSTVDTEPMVINGKFYRWYPKIRKEDIGKDTSNKFIDTCSISNAFIILMGARHNWPVLRQRSA